MTPQPRLLVFGRAGQLAQSLAEAAAARQVPLMSIGRDRLDLASLSGGWTLGAIATDVASAIKAFAPTHIVNAAAYTAVDKAESEPELAFRLNCDAPEALARIASDLGAAFIHLSTDYVFDGDKAEPYVETDPVGPRSVYGESKLAGERAVLAADPGALVLRTAWVYSPFGANFVKTMLRVGLAGGPLRVVDDQLGCPTSAPDLANAILDISASPAAMGGVYHLVGSGETTWHGFAEAIFNHVRASGGRDVQVAAIPTSAYPTPAARPANSRLNCDAFAGRFGVRLPEWRDSLATCLVRLRPEIGALT